MTSVPYIGNLTNIKQIIVWLRTNTKGRYESLFKDFKDDIFNNSSSYQDEHNIFGFYIKFENPNDALLFKLTWC